MATPSLKLDRLEQVPPMDIETEQRVLKCALNSAQARREILAMLEPEDFYRESHQRLFRLIKQLDLAGEPIDPYLISSELDVDKPKFLVLDILAVDSIAANAKAYARLVKDKAELRKLMALCSEFYTKAIEERDVGELKEELTQKISLWCSVGMEKKLISIGELGDEFIRELEEVSKSEGGLTGWTTGHRTLDRVLSGLHAGDLYVIAARTNMGKSSLALNIAAKAAQAGAKVQLYSLEMGKKLIYRRLLSMMAQVDGWKIMTGRLSPSDWAAIKEAKEEISGLDLRIHDSMISTVADIEQSVRDQKYGTGLDIVVVDYLQLMSGSNKKQNREQEVAEISRGLKMIAVKYDVVVIAVSQVSRAAEMGENKRPDLKDLRESGAIENDADVVMFLYREDYYKPNCSEKGMAEILIRKNRNGACGDFKLRFIPQYTSFEDLGEESWL